MFKLMLLGILFFFTFFNFNLAICYKNHAGFIINTFEHNDATVSEEAATQVVNHGALHYTIGMRGFYLSAPLARWLFGPIWVLAAVWCWFKFYIAWIVRRKHIYSYK
jgi:uncharacterized membrane protein